MKRKRKRKNKNRKPAVILVILFIIIGFIIFKICNSKKTETSSNNEESTTSEVANNNVENTEQATEKNKEKVEEQSWKNRTKPEREALSSNGLPVLMYHFFYDNVKYFKEDNNWLNVKDFEEQLKYLSENDFYYPTWDEVKDYIDGKTILPSKSVVLTVDDGDASFFDLAVPLLQKYKVPATTFVITDWYGWRYDDKMEYVYWESHSAGMHEPGANGKGLLVNSNYAKIVEDMKKSSNILGGAKVYCYPFGHYNDTAIRALKSTNYDLAFTIEGGRVKKGANKYALPRVRVTAGNSLNYFIKSIS